MGFEGSILGSNEKLQINAIFGSKKWRSNAGFSRGKKNPLNFGGFWGRIVKLHLNAKFHLGKKIPATMAGRKIFVYFMARRIFSATPYIFSKGVEHAATLTPNLSGTAKIKSSWSFLQTSAGFSAGTAIKNPPL